MDSQTIKRSHPGKSEGSMPAAVNKTARITNPANQLMITMTAISPLLMLRSSLPAIIIFRRLGKSISGIPDSQSWPKNSPAEAPAEQGPRAAGRSDGGLTLTYLREKVDRELSLCQQHGTCLRDTYLCGTYLRDTYLLGTCLRATYLRDTCLRGTCLIRLLTRLGIAALFSKNGIHGFRAVGYTSHISRFWNPWLSWLVIQVGYLRRI